MGKKVAIVGSGCSGLGALWALKSTDHEVHLFERDSTLGGHANTVSFKGLDGENVNVDVGFIVMNTATYRRLSPCCFMPQLTLVANFMAFLDRVGIQPSKIDMTFGVSRDQGKFEWAGTSLSSIFAQRRNIFRLRMWKLIFEIVRFNEFAIDVLRYDDESEDNPATFSQPRKASLKPQESIGEYLDREAYSQTFRDDYLIPMIACIWSTSPDKCSLHFPAVTLIRFLWNHHLLDTVAARPDWMTIPGGSRRYIDAIMKSFPPDRTHMKSKVTAVVPSRHDTVFLTSNGKDLEFDHVILATHGDQALDILEPVATKEEVDILSGFQTSRNIVVLHSDTTLMPKRRIAWSSWNSLTQSPFPPKKSSNITKLCLTHWMNLLQHIPESKFGPVLVTMNPLRMPDPRVAQGIWEYTHPLCDAAAIRSQKLLPNIQNTRNISYCGAWTKYGFHEDGFSSGLSVAMEHLGAELPFRFVDSTFSRGRKPTITWRDHAVRIVVLYMHMMIVILTRLLDMVVAFLNRKSEKSKSR